jgi:hypothetical protein
MRSMTPADWRLPSDSVVAMLASLANVVTPTGFEPVALRLGI